MSNGGSLRMKTTSKKVSASVRISWRRKWMAGRSTSTRRTVACGTVRSTKRSGGSQWYCVWPRRWPSSWKANVVSLSISTRLIGSITQRTRRGAIGGETSRAARPEPTARVLPVSPPPLAVRGDGDGGGLRAQHTRPEAEPDEAARLREGDLRRGEAAFGSDQSDHGLGMRRQLVDTPRLLTLPRHEPKP